MFYMLNFIFGVLVSPVSSSLCGAVIIVAVLLNSEFSLLLLFVFSFFARFVSKKTNVTRVCVLATASSKQP